MTAPCAAAGSAAKDNYTSRLTPLHAKPDPRAEILLQQRELIRNPNSYDTLAATGALFD